MKRLVLLFAALLLPLALRAQPRVGASLEAALAAAGAGETLEVIVTFDGDGALGAAPLGVLQQLGVRGVYMRSLPIAGVVATPAQVARLRQTPGVRSLWLNERLEYDNYEATALTGVDRLRADSRLRNAQGLPFSGKGVGVVINDSGVDGTLPDLAYPQHVVQNVAGQTNLASLSSLLPVTYAEGVINTDIGGGHGTHVAGIIGGSGASSRGRHEGVAPGAGLVGYGSGAALFILDTIGGFDYALTHQFDYNIRVVSNSFGSTSDVGTPFDPDDPTNVATKACADRGIVVVFSAGNSGPGARTITGNFKKAPWVVTVAAGTKQGELADFSSRGQEGAGGTVTVGGQTFTWTDRPTITAPGAGIVSARATTSALAPLSITDDVNLAPSELPFYTTMSGTSMACPHVSGIVALMLEANPGLDVYGVKRILEATATNIPGREGYEAGAGYVNAYDAVVMALGRRTDFGTTVALGQTFNSRVVLHQSEEAYTLTFDPTGVSTQTAQFNVAPGTLQLEAGGTLTGVEGETGNSVGVRLTAPDGTRYTSGISALFPLYTTRSVTVDGPQPGTWTVDLYGVNGVGLPETAPVYVLQKAGSEVVGLNDVSGHPAEGAILAAVGQRLVDGDASGRFHPDATLKRIDLARFLTMGAGIRQSLVLEGGRRFSDVSPALAPYAEAVAARSGALRDVFYAQDAVVPASASTFNPGGSVTRLDLAYALVQALGLEAAARAFSGTLQAEFDGTRYPVEDAGSIPANRRGYVQIALDLGLLPARFALTQGPFDLSPVLHATFAPAAPVSRADYAVAATRFHDRYMQGDLGLGAAGGSAEAGPDALAKAGAEAEEESQPASITFRGSQPNPLAGQGQLVFTLSEGAQVRLAVYDALGREVTVLHEGWADAGTHSISLNATVLSVGTYFVRLESSLGTQTRTVSVAR